MQWGFNPDTISAIATAVAAVAAAIAGFVAWHAYRAEREARELTQKAYALTESSYRADLEREQRELEQGRRSQAQQISVWAITDDEQPDRVDICLQNLSSAPVYFVRIGFVLNKKSVYAGWMRVLPPMVGAPSRCAAKSAAVERWQHWAAGRHPRPEASVEITFRDAARSWWYRNEHGVLAATAEE